MFNRSNSSDEINFFSGEFNLGLHTSSTINVAKIGVLWFQSNDALTQNVE